MNRRFLKEFNAPPNECRAVPFWGWNARMEPEELRRQVRILRRMGFGGFFVHSRVGLETPYLSDEWMDRIETCVEEAEKLGMTAWLYDDDRWPSGFAGGIVTRNPKYSGRMLEMVVHRESKGFRWEKDTLAAFVARVDPPNVAGVKRLARGRRPARLERGESILTFRVRPFMASDWHNGQTYVDTMNPEAIREFLRVTHEAYRKRFGDRFGKSVPGIFTDEPHYARRKEMAPGTGEVVPWTDRLPAVFRRRYGFDIVNHLPELFYDLDGQGIAPARWRFRDCLTFLFTDSFARQIGEWCAKHGLLHTGHVLSEQTLWSQTYVVGSAMRFYEHMQAPGIDVLTEYRREYDTAKQLSSAARQFGQRWRLSETYGCTGWEFDFEGHKAVSDWQAALGVNLRCQHFAFYTMLGEAKRDYPASIFFQSPWWEHYRLVEDYFARIHVAMSRGREVRDILVVHPVESAWVLSRAGDDALREELNRRSEALRDALLAENLDFDYGDEDILARHGRVTRRGGRVVLRVAEAEYSSVVVPRLLTVRSTTLALLKKFQKAGGEIVFVGNGADRVDALPSDEARALAVECVRVRRENAEVARVLDPSARRVSIADSDGDQIRPALYCLREDRDAFYLFVCNTGQDQFGKGDGTHNEKVAVRRRRMEFPDVRIRLKGQGGGRPVELDPLTGETFAAAGSVSSRGWTVRTSFSALGSRLFVFPKRESAVRLAPRKLLKQKRSKTLDPSEWEIQLSETNCLVLDRPRSRIAGGAWKKPEDILRIDDAVRRSLGIARRSGSMKQPWARTAPPRPRSTVVELEYEFEVRDIPVGPLYLGIERPDTFSIALNGQPVGADAECGWWVDPSMRKVPLDPALLRTGRNALSLACSYGELHPGLEIVYLLGAFGARAKGTDVSIVEFPQTLRLGDWTRQGLAFYGGSVTYSRTIRPDLRAGERLFVHIPSYEGVAVRVLVEGREAGVVGWEPNEVDITPFVGTEPVRIGIQVLGHRRNSHGPLHTTHRPRTVGPTMFRTSGEWWQDEYHLVPCGLTSPPKLIVKK
ncbi:hypothetical protein JW916_14370 [Candidatus Sumerlaeota bacterium]|nr:hypothetical protein [Candidatus Sumerlaeota bacterium]